MTVNKINPNQNITAFEMICQLCSKRFVMLPSFLAAIGLANQGFEKSGGIIMFSVLLFAGLGLLFRSKTQDNVGTKRFLKLGMVFFHLLAIVILIGSFQ